MGKLQVDADCFDQLTKVDLQRKFQWLSPLSSCVDRIADFGCWGGDEPFALLWTLDATEVVVIEKDEQNFTKVRATYEWLQNSPLKCLDGRSMRFITADMSIAIPELPSSYFDLAYCEDVLYFMQNDPKQVQNAINEMARVVKPGGFVIAQEPKFGVVIEQFTVSIFTFNDYKSDPEDIRKLFENAGLGKIELTESVPFWLYFYQKPLSDSP